MGRPISDRFFGNRNIGSESTTSDDQIGGEFVTGVTFTNRGSYTAVPSVTFSSPTIPTGVAATGTAIMRVLGATVDTAGTGYTLGENLSIGGGGTFNVSALTVVGITIQNGGSANDIGDEFTFAITGFETPLRVRVTNSTTGTATAVSIVDGGSWTSGTLPTNTIGMTRTQVAAGQDYNGVNLQVNITAWGVKTVSVASRSSYASISSNPRATTSNRSGTGAQLNVTYELSDVALVEGGSGYINAADAALTFSPASTTAATAVLNVDSGAEGTHSNQENALFGYAYIDGGREAVDIIAQKGSYRYDVITADGVIYNVALVGRAATADGEMDLTAVDSSGKTYYVTRLNMAQAFLTQYGSAGHEFEDQSIVRWSIDEPVEGYSVQVTNH
jgi:hypothetical protein